MSSVDEAAAFEAERPRLVPIAEGMLRDVGEAEDIVQQAWLRLQGTDADIENLAGWATTVTTRLCLVGFARRFLCQKRTSPWRSTSATPPTRWLWPTPSASRYGWSWTG